jgi:hypothetical protein
MAKKEKVKKISAKKEKYAKFHKEKADTVTFTSPELSDEQIKQQRLDQEKFERFIRFRGLSPKEINLKKKEFKR